MKRGPRGEGSIYRRRNGRWVGQVQNDMGERFFVYGRTQADVRTRLTAIKRDLQQSVPPITATMTLGQYLQQWLVESAKPTVRDSTFVSYRAIVKNHLVPRMGAVKVAKLTPQMVERFLNERLAAGFSPRRAQFSPSPSPRAPAP